MEWGEIISVFLLLCTSAFTRFFFILYTVLCLIINILWKHSCIKIWMYLQKGFHLIVIASALKTEINIDAQFETLKIVQNSSKLCKIVQKLCKIVQKLWKIFQNRAAKGKMAKNVHLKNFWTQFKIVHCRGPCSLRPCISRPYCINALGQNLANTKFCPIPAEIVVRGQNL